MAEQNRRAHAEKVKPQRVFASPFPETEHRPDCADEKNRIEQQGFAGQKIPEVPQRRLPLGIQTRVGRHMMHGDPIVLRVPNDNRQRADAKNQQREPRAGAA